MASNRTTTTGRRGGRPPRSKPGAKKELILQVAVEAFGRSGYEDAKWADVASAVGIGPTPLYHYFQSKLHCLYEIMGLAVADFQQRFERITAEPEDLDQALPALLVDPYALTQQEGLRNRVLVP